MSVLVTLGSPRPRPKRDDLIHEWETLQRAAGILWRKLDPSRKFRFLSRKRFGRVVLQSSLGGYLLILGGLSVPVGLAFMALRLFQTRVVEVIGAGSHAQKAR